MTQLSQPATNSTASDLIAGLAAILDPVPGAWYITRQDATFAFVSRGASRWLGYSSEELQQMSILEIDLNLSRELWDRMWANSAPPDTATVQTSHRRKDGETVPVEVRAVRLYLGGEDLAVSYAVDASRNEWTRAALEASEAQHQRLLDHLPDLVFRLRTAPSLAFTSVSPNCHRLVGYTPEEMVDHPRGLVQFIHADDLQTFTSLAETTDNSGPRVRFVHKRGHVVWMDVRATRRISSPEQTEALEGVARDITLSRETELSHRRLLTAIEQVGEAVVVTNADGIVVYANPTYEQRSGIPFADALHTPWRTLEIRSDSLFVQRLARTLQTGESWKGRVRSQSPQGQPYEEEVSLSPWRDPSGEVIGCVAVKRDITEWLQVQEHLHQSQKLEAVGQLAGGIAHDFNNLLQIVQGNTTEIGQRVDDPHVTSLVGSVLTAVQRGSTLVKQLLTFSRTGTVEFSSLDLVDCVWSLRDMLRRVMGAQIELSWQCSASSPVISGNGAQLEQAIVNLCINARDAMPTGGKLQLSVQNVQASEVPAAAPCRRTHVLVTVSDTGHGMDSRTVSRLYEPFFTTKETGKGTGLGLSTVYAIVQAHQGCIEVDSAVGRGTTFRLYFPVEATLSIDCSAAAAEQPPMAPSAVATESSSRGIALVAEDEPAILELTAGFLRSVGFEVLAAADGEQALNTLNEHGTQIDLAVLDVMMPKHGGLSLYRFIQNRQQNIPVVFVSGFDRDALAEVPPGPNVAIVTKPFSRRQLLDKVELLLLHPKDE